MEMPIVRAIDLLAAASPEMTSRQLWSLSIGERDKRLIALRESLFGSELEAVATCPLCAEQVELNFSTTDLRAGFESEQEATVEIGGRSLRLRAPNSEDLLSLRNPKDLAQCCNVLLRRCLSDADGGELSAEIEETVAQKIEQIDPFADIRMCISCPKCQHSWREIFDIVSLLWSEIARWASRILRDVHMLASAYGWSEKEILALSPTRRQTYLDMVAA